MKLQITNYQNNIDLDDAITRYYTLLQMSFETNIYKIFETPESQIYKSINKTPNLPAGGNNLLPNPLIADIECGKCHTVSKIQINFATPSPMIDGVIPFPKNNMFKCPHCGAETDVLGLRLQLEAQTGKNIV